MLVLLAAFALQHPSARPPDLLKRAHTYSKVDLGDIFARRHQ